MFLQYPIAPAQFPGDPRVKAVIELAYQEADSLTRCHVSRRGGCKSAKIGVAVS